MAQKRMLIRERYLQKIVPFIDKPLIKVLLGVRRSGKTVLLSQIRAHIAASGVRDEQLISLNFESFSSRPYLTAEALYRFVAEKSRETKGRLYLFFDEIQEVSDWQKAVNAFLVDFDCDVYLTGSNSNLLSGELATYIAGRYVHFTVYPFSFSETLAYTRALGRTENEEMLFDEYLRFGGLPQRFLLRDPDSVRTYLSDVFSTIVVKDILSRHKFGDSVLLTRLTAFLLENAGNPFSANAICRRLKAEGIHTTVATLLDYIAAVKEAMVVVTAPRYDLKGKALLSTNEKYYAIDLGLRNNVKSSDILDYSKLYENAVFLELLSRGYEINVGKEGPYEIDFVCMKGREKCYVQVAYLLSDASVVEREFRPLREIGDNFPKYVISGDRHDFSGEGILHRNILRFLTENS